MSDIKKYFIKRIILAESMFICGALLLMFGFGFIDPVVLIYSVMFGFMGIFFGLYVWLVEYPESKNYKQCPKCGGYFKKDDNIVKCLSCDFKDLEKNQKLKP